MRPVNLIPPEDRRGDRAPLRSGPLSYVVIGALAVALLAVVLVVTTSNEIAERKAQVDQLEADLDAATAEAERLAPYTEFATLRTQREATLASLAQSRFDWERVMRELALVIPAEITLTDLNGAATANAEGSAATDEIGAPNLALSGCAVSHSAVAEFVAALEDIDGVTRVGLGRTEAIPEQSDSDATGAGSQVCGDANTFDISVAFDNATVSGVAAEGAAVNPSPETTPVTAEAGAPADSGTATEPTANSAAEQTEKAKKAASIPGQVTP